MEKYRDTFSFQFSQLRGCFWNTGQEPQFQLNALNCKNFYLKHQRSPTDAFAPLLRKGKLTIFERITCLKNYL